MKLTFEMVAATDVDTFDRIVNEKLAKGYRFITGQPAIVTPIKKGFQYSVPMLLEEQV